MPARSSIAPQRAAGVRAEHALVQARDLLRARLVRSVSNQPGKRALTWMLSAAQARPGSGELDDAALAGGVGGAKLAPKIDIMGRY